MPGSTGGWGKTIMYIVPDALQWKNRMDDFLAAAKSKARALEREREVINTATNGLFLGGVICGFLNSSFRVYSRKPIAFLLSPLPPLPHSSFLLPLECGRRRAASRHRRRLGVGQRSGGVATTPGGSRPGGRPLLSRSVSCTLQSPKSH